MLDRAYALTVAFNEEWQSYALSSAELIIRNWPRKMPPLIFLFKILQLRQK